MYKAQYTDRLSFQIPFIIFCLITCCARISKSQVNDTHNPYHDVDHSGEILNFLLNSPSNNYDPDLIPISDGKALNVDIHIVVTELTNFDGVNQALSFICWVKLHWFDKRLKWDPLQFGNTTSIRISPPRIWKPDITLYNSADGRHQLTEDMINQVHCRVYHTGTVAWSPIVMYTITCPMKLYYFPFDVQVCQANIGSWVHNMERLHFNLTDNKVKLDKFTGNNVWWLKDTIALDYAQDYGEDMGTYQEVRFFFFLRRNYKQYILNIILTCSLLCFLAFFSFWIPVGAGERLSLSLSVIVAVSVYQLIGATLIPTGNDKTPVISIFLAVMAILVDLSVVVTMVNLKIADQIQIVRPPTWLIDFVVDYLVGFFLLRNTYEFKKYSKYKKENSQEMKQSFAGLVRKAHKQASYANNSPSPTNRDEMRIRSICQNPLKILRRRSNEDTGSSAGRKLPSQRGKRQSATIEMNRSIDLHGYEKLADTEWDLVSLCLDRLCMFLYGVTFMTMLIWLFCRLDTYNSQLESLAESIMEIDKKKHGEAVYDCYFNETTGDLAPMNETYKQFFCDKNQTLWDLI